MTDNAKNKVVVLGLGQWQILDVLAQKILGEGTNTCQVIVAPDAPHDHHFVILDSGIAPNVKYRGEYRNNRGGLSPKTQRKGWRPR